MYINGFLGYRIGLEYDRQGEGGRERKKVQEVSGAHTTGRRLDINIHHRGSQQGNNLLIAEFKLIADSDADRVKAVMRQMDYRYGVAVILNSGDPRVPRWRWFDSAESSPDLVAIPRPENIG
ncbi:MAG TPA: hypothetical protein PK781_00980 [Terrimesophilobacter sp.]|nr:hypothetical protein [Terrimesophilobacter sp.]